MAPVAFDAIPGTATGSHGTCANAPLSGAAQRNEHHRLVIDLDPQVSLTLAMGLRNVPREASLYAFFKDARPLAQLVRPQSSGVELIPGSFDLSKSKPCTAAA